MPAISSDLRAVPSVDEVASALAHTGFPHKLIVAETAMNPESASRLLSLSPKDGLLNLSGARTVLDIRSEFSAPPLKGPALEAYVDSSYFQEAAPQ